MPINEPHQPPREIKKLDQAVVNRIAAGEIIQRPANAAKELIENSIDAGATQVTVIAKEGGIKVLQVQDNGCGIRYEDLPILCERHTTSKLRTFDDVYHLETLGFRGEALASISYVSHVTVTTMQRGSDDQGRTVVHGWRATYRDGVLDPSPPKACAATPGTTILAEDLFYNSPLRRKSIKSPSDEYSNIIDVVGQYAVYHASASFTVKKSGESKSDLHTQQGGTRRDAIKNVYGTTISKNLVPLSFTRGGHHADDMKPKEQHRGVASAAAADDDFHAPADSNMGTTSMCCHVDGFVTNGEYSGRKTQLVLFINGRCVECSPLRKCIESTYSAILPKTTKPFVFMDVKIPLSDVDVNVHPTKKEVAFLFQEEFIDAVRSEVEGVLTASHDHKTYHTYNAIGSRVVGAPNQGQEGALPALGGVVPRPSQQQQQHAIASAATIATAAPSYYRPDKLIRTDASLQTLHAFYKQKPSMTTPHDLNARQHNDLTAVPSRPRRHQRDDSAPAVPDGRSVGGIDARSGQGSFMPTALDISSDVAQRMRCLESDVNGGVHDATLQQEQQQQQEQQHRHAPVKHTSNPKHSTGIESVEQLIYAIEHNAHSTLADLFTQPTFVGMADSHRALVQSGTRLYLFDLTVLTRDMFYQQALYRFGRFPRIPLSPPLSIRELTHIALQAEEVTGKWQDSKEEGTKEEVSELLQELLIKKSELLRECFSIGVDEKGYLTHIPQLIEQYQPLEEYLPRFVLDLGQNIDWQDEGRCYEGLAGALAELYALHPQYSGDDGEDGDYTIGGSDGGSNGEDEGRVEGRHGHGRRAALEWEVAHVLMPALRLFLNPQKARAIDGTVVELTRLEQLYRVFERC